MESKSLLKTSTFVSLIAAPFIAFGVLIFHIIAIYAAAAITKSQIPTHAYSTTILFVVLGFLILYFDLITTAKNNYHSSFKKPIQIILSTLPILCWVMPAIIVKPHFLRELIIFIFHQF